MTYNQVSKYVSMMRDLCIKKTNGIMAPHKAIMLLSIIELIENGKIKSNVIPIDYIISDIFRINWMKYVANNERFAIYTCNPWTPFWHLNNEPFWHFMPIKDCICVDNIVPPGQTASVGKMKANIKYAYLDPMLFSLLCNSENRIKLSAVLFDTYLHQ